MGFNILQILATCLFAIICLSVLLYIIYLIYEIRFSYKQIVLFLLSSGIATSISSYLLFYYGLNTLKAVVNIPFLVIFMLVFLRLNISRSVLCTGLYTIMLAFSSAIVNLIFPIIGFGYDSNANGSLKLNIYAYSIMVVFNLCIAFLIKFFKSYITLPQEAKSKAYRKVIANLVFVLVIIIANFSYYSLGYAVEKPQLFLNVFLILCYFIFSIYNINTSFQLESKRQELEYQLFYNKTLESIMNNLRRFKHNYNNMLAVINGYIMVKRWDELKNYMGEILQQENKDAVFNNLMLLKIKNAGLFGLITNKIQYASERGIDMKIIIDDDIGEVGIRISELCEIMGILLDNAIEASSESDERHLKFIIGKTNGSISFTIENSFKEQPDVQKIYEKSYSTKGRDRGLGLWILNNMIKKNKNVMLNTFINDNKFRQDLIVSE